MTQHGYDTTGKSRVLDLRNLQESPASTAPNAAPLPTRPFPSVLTPRGGTGGGIGPGPAPWACLYSAPRSLTRVALRPGRGWALALRQEAELRGGERGLLRQAVSDDVGGASAAGGQRRRVRVSRAEPGCGGRGAWAGAVAKGLRDSMGEGKWGGEGLGPLWPVGTAGGLAGWSPGSRPGI